MNIPFNHESTEPSNEDQEINWQKHNDSRELTDAVSPWSPAFRIILLLGAGLLAWVLFYGAISAVWTLSISAVSS
jgi:hypothetical protein